MSERPPRDQSAATTNKESSSITTLSHGVPLSVCAECLIPAGADAAQERRIDDQLAERVNQGHVDRREAANVPHVDAEIEPVAICRFGKGAQRGGVGGAVDKLEELLVFEVVHDAEKTFTHARWRKGL
jgi:hypothetical protein